eukprot:7361367-Prymnesium_polylepis.1
MAVALVPVARASPQEPLPCEAAPSRRRRCCARSPHGHGGRAWPCASRAAAAGARRCRHVSPAPLHACALLQQ